jgi:hypothetical protein
MVSAEEDQNPFVRTHRAWDYSHLFPRLHWGLGDQWMLLQKSWCEKWHASKRIDFDSQDKRADS